MRVLLIDAFQFTLIGTTMGRRYPLQNAILKKDTLDRDSGWYTRFVKALKLERILLIPVAVRDDICPLFLQNKCIIDNRMLT
jgi:hypothetical protein